MIKKVLFYIIWALVIAILLYYSLNYKGGDEAMVAQVESEVTAISYQKPVLVRNLFVTPGQVVEAGDLLLEVERPDLKLDYDKLLKNKQQMENGLADARAVFENSNNILETKYRGSQSKLELEKEELQHQARLYEKNRQRLDSVSSISLSANDSIRRKKIALIDVQLTNLDREFNAEKERLVNTYQTDTFTFQTELDIISKELRELEIEKAQLQKRAEKRSTIGNVFVQLHELVPPFQTLISLYDINPTQIKAFMHERGVESLKIGNKVMVKSVNKNYEIAGQIVEIGSRITSYPDKINPLMNQKSYGQEVFIKIPGENDFLNGQKVYVYLIDDEE